jgi:hypothetical protein
MKEEFDRDLSDKLDWLLLNEGLLRRIPESVSTS